MYGYQYSFTITLTKKETLSSELNNEKGIQHINTVLSKAVEQSNLTLKLQQY